MLHTTSECYCTFHVIAACISIVILLEHVVVDAIASKRSDCIKCGGEVE